MRVAAVALLASLVVVPGASARQGLVGGKAVLRPDERIVVVEARCQAGAVAADCRGRARFTTFDGSVATYGRQVAIRPGTRTRLALRLLPGGISIIARDTNAEALASLRVDRGRKRSETDVFLSVRPTCASGSTVGTSPMLRVFRLRGFGVYACATGARPLLLADETDSSAGDSAGHIRVAGRYVALSISGGFKCTGTALYEFDVPARRRVRSRGVSTTVESYANGCTSSGHIAALVLRPSGAVAYSESPGDDGVARILAIDAAGGRILATGTGVDPGSLRSVDPFSVSWRDGDAMGSAVLR